MKPKNNIQELPKKDAELCGTLGFVGATIATVTLFQHFYFMTTVWVAYAMMLVYMFTIVAYILLITKKSTAPVLLIIASGLLLLTMVYYTLAVAFSLLVTLLMLYTLVITILVFIEEMPQKLTSHNLYKKENDAYWANKL